MWLWDVNVTVFLLQKYYHGESIAINVLVDNNTNKTVKKIKISGDCVCMEVCASEVCVWEDCAGEIVCGEGCAGDVCVCCGGGGGFQVRCV